MIQDEPERTRLAMLTLRQPNQPDRQLVLHGEAYRLGRNEGLEIAVEHPAVSRQHALLRRRGRHWMLIDLESTNGLWWRGRRIRELELRDGDRVSLAPATEAGAPTLHFHNPAERGLRRVEQWIARGLLLALGGGGLVLSLAALQVPVRGRLASVQGPIAIYDRNNKPLDSVDSSRHRELQSIGSFSPDLVHALLSSEDNRFWWHPGVDPVGTLRAFATNLTGGRLMEGGSSLTQQLARSLYPDQVGQGDTLGRKWRELLVALQLESRFSKGDLLLSYLNRVYLGVGWGFEDAARTYFGKSASQLSLEESALLVGLLPSPNGHDPCQYPQRALEARNRVLNKMADAGRLSLDQARQARRRPIQLSKSACSQQSTRRSAPFYTDQVRRDLSALVGPEVAAEGNFLVETHLDPLLQAVLERQLQRLLNEAQGLGVREGAAVVIDQRNGGVLAITGGKDYRFSQFNRATMALRQPGSTFKLMTYLAALQRGIKAGDAVDCGPLDWGGQRFESTCGGQLSLTSAFASSSNTAALRLARRVGLEQVVRQARALGINTPLDPVPGLALGQSEVRLIDLTAAYAAVANDGLWNPPTTIRRLLDAESCAAEKVKRCGSLTGTDNTRVTSARRALRKDVAKSMQAMLRSVVRAGTGTAASLGGQEGGKTGTTNDGRDLLFIGYEPSRHWVLGIWLGNDDNSPTASSSALAASLWGDIMRAAGRGSKESP
jgi:penicillin-binding protein 1A